MTKDERIQGLLEANNFLVEQRRLAAKKLKECREKFAFYADEHRKKTGLSAEDTAKTLVKARTNEKMVSDIDDTLLLLAPR